MTNGSEEPLRLNPDLMTTLWSWPTVLAPIAFASALAYAVLTVRPWLPTVVALLAVGVTAWMALSTLHMARATKRMADSSLQALTFTQSVERVRLLTDLLNTFDERVLREANSYDRAAKGNSVMAHYYGPTGRNSSQPVDPFHHPTFLTRAESLRLTGTEEISPLQVLNPLEQFATAVFASVYSNVWDTSLMSRLAAPTRRTFVLLANQYYDVLCAYRSHSELFSGVSQLYQLWEPELAVELAQYRQHLADPLHGMVERIQAYRIGTDHDFADWTGHMVGSANGPGAHSWTTIPEFVWVQAVGGQGRGIGGCEVTLSLDRDIEITMVEGVVESQTSTESGNRLSIRTNSTGTLSFEVLRTMSDADGRQFTISVHEGPQPQKGPAIAVTGGGEPGL